MDLLLEALPALTAGGAQLALLGSGDKAARGRLSPPRQRATPGASAAMIGYDEALAHLRAGRRRRAARAVALRALRPHPALRAALRRDSRRRARRRPRRHGRSTRTRWRWPRGAGTGIQFAPVTREQLELAIERAHRAVARPRGLAPPASARDGDRRRLDPPREAVRRALPRACAALGDRRGLTRMRRVGPGSPEPLGVTLGAGRRQRRGLLRARDGDRALPVRRGGRDRARAHRAARAHRRRLPRLRRRDRGRRSLRAARARRRTIPRNGHRFNPAKLLVDPYARALDRPFALHPAMFGGGADGADARRHRQRAVRAQGDRDRAAAAGARRSVRACRGHETILYELHVRGFTRAHPDVPEALRGTCAGLAHPAAIAHLTRLGVTTVELMPIAAAIDERHLARARPHQLLGLQPGRAVRPRSAARARRHRRARARCVAALHAAGIEVHPRRRAQPHRRGRRARADAVAARPRQRDLLPDRCRRSRRATSTTPAAATRWRSTGRRCCASRWTSFATTPRPPASTASASTSRRRSAAATTASIPAAPLLQAIAQDPAAARAASSSPSRGTSDRAAIASAPFPPRGANGTTAIATPCGASGAATPALHRRARDAPRRFGRRLRGTLAPAVALGQLRHRARRLHARRSRRRTRPSTTRRTARATATAPTPTTRGITASRARPPTPPSRAARARDVRNLLATLLPVARHADARDGRRARAHAAGQQQRLRAGQRADVDRLGERGRALIAFVARARRAAQAPPGAARATAGSPARRSTRAAFPTSNGGTRTAAR